MNREILKLKPNIDTLFTRKKVAAYVRVSDGKDAMLHSLSAQVSYYSKLIQENREWKYAGVYVDEAKTGTKDKRPEFQRLIADCRAGKIDMIITKSITRFARNTLTVLETSRELKFLGIDIYFEKEKIHTISEEGELMLTLLSSFAQEESRSVSENCKWRIRDKFKQGIPTSFRIFGYDFVDNQLIVNKKEAKIVKMIFSDYLSGMGINAIVRKLVEDGICTKNGGIWRENVVYGILTNEKYTGNLILQKSFIKDHIEKKKCQNNGELPKYYVENSHEAIIDKEIFLEVQKEVERRSEFGKYRNPRNTYPFTGKIKCGICGKKYKRKINASGTKYEKPVWICSTYNTYGKKHCASHQIPEETLEKIAAKTLKLSKFDATIFKEKIKQILVPAKCELEFIFFDGKNSRETWEYPSRSESWTQKMRKNQAKLYMRQTKFERRSDD